jgi:hypothetical protein
LLEEEGDKGLAFDEPVRGVWASDHFGVVAGLSVSGVCS